MLKNREKNRVKISRFLTPAKIRGGLGEILAVRYRVRPRPPNICGITFMTLFLVVSEIRGRVFKVYAKKKDKRQQQKIRQPYY